MILSITLSKYFGKQFFIGILMALSLLIGLVFLVDFVELLRRASGEDINIGIIISMAILKLPTMIQKIFPFAFLFGGIFTFARLTKTHELVVTRAAGVSVWQFLLPAMIIALICGTFVVTVFNPLSSIMASQYELLETRHYRKSSSLLSLSTEGLWIRKAGETRLSVIHAERATDEGIDLSNVIIFLYDTKGENFLGRIDAKSARLETPLWKLNNVIVTLANETPKRFDNYELSTTLTTEQIQDSFASPETLSFWILPGFISILRDAGFGAVKHRVHWHSILSIPFFLCAMVLIAATFALRLTAKGGTSLLIVGGVLAGFILYVLSDIVLALGLSGKIPPILAAWTPAGISALIGLSLLFHLEDG
ncbi:LPS export ABC transporter permease LptG [Alphaproteobacteria bacterium]|nr:LPS export ABC transporter permease LptG [Alphaproteobacteria bacterium]